ncbi:MAG: hypothetical protein A3H95_03360 [Acidobacteria bacterium RIFCSPLOWO2_02_FULL_64_15]|nr:MAG: hypothetical protein A3H95_03360 [Acidobacteria bacterium RIFCSPLOWO2_02_FULL_64_15]
MPKLGLSPSTVLAPDDSGYLSYDAGTGRLSRLNPAAALIAELCDGTRDASEIEVAVAPLLGASGQDACRTWIRSALASGMLQEVHGRHDVAARSPHEPKALAARAWRLRDNGLVLPAFVCQWHAAHLEPTNASHWHALGELAHIVGRRAVARDAYERYLALKPDDAEIGHLLVSLRDEPAPPRAPDRCIEQLYARFATYYEENMCGDLDYRAPACLDTAIGAALDDRRNLTVLELGCGTGLAGRLLRPRARRLVGIDLSEAMVARAAATGVYDALEVAEITAWLARADRPRFDLVAACDTLIYFGDLRQVIVPAARHLASAGWIAFTVERDEAYPFRLTDAGRYAHHADHVREVAAEASLTVRQLDTVELRYEYGEPVTGLVVVLQMNM